MKIGTPSVVFQLKQGGVNLGLQISVAGKITFVIFLIMGAAINKWMADGI